MEPLRPYDHIDADRGDTDTDADRGEAAVGPAGEQPVTQPRLGPTGYLRFFWRQLTTMQTALFLLLLLAVAAVPGSLVPQRTSDPNGVVQYETDHPDLYPLLQALQLFDVYSSVWFSAIYLLLFVSLIGCIVPRTRHHWQALRSRPPKTPQRLERLAGYRTAEADADPEDALESARALLRRQGYRVERYDLPGHGTAEPSLSVSAERGYLRETGNLVFHSALVGILVVVGVVSGFGYSGQKVIVEGQAFTNVLAGYDSFNPGRFFNERLLEPFSLTLDGFADEYGIDERGSAVPLDYRADVTVTRQDGTSSRQSVKVNEPLQVAGTSAYLLGNGYAPVITVYDGSGQAVFSQAVPFLPQDANLTSVGVVKVPDAVPEQLGMIGFFYPWAVELADGAFASAHPETGNPLLTLNVYTGDLGLDAGVPRSVYSLDVDELTQVAGGDTGVESLMLAPGERVDLPDGLGAVEFTELRRFVSLDLHDDPTQGWVLGFAVLVLAGLLASLFVPRRRVWVKVLPQPHGGCRVEYAGLARGEDPGLDAAVADIALRHSFRISPRMPQ